MRGFDCQNVAPFGTLLALADELMYCAHVFRQMDPENKPTRDELKEEVLKVSKGLAGLGGFNLVSVERRRDATRPRVVALDWRSYDIAASTGWARVMAAANTLQTPTCTALTAVVQFRGVKLSFPPIFHLVF